MKVLAWLSLSFVVFGTFFAASPFLLAWIGGEDSDWTQVGWVFLFVTVPLGLFLVGVAIVLMLIVGIRGLADGGPRLFGVLAVACACGSGASMLAVFAIVAGNALGEFVEVNDSLLLTLVVVTAALLILNVVSTFVVAFSSPARLTSDGEAHSGA